VVGPRRDAPIVIVEIRMQERWVSAPIAPADPAQNLHEIRPQESVDIQVPLPRTASPVRVGVLYQRQRGDPARRASFSASYPAQRD
jgi:hypothetical protein